jgi:hypothetical protein
MRRNAGITFAAALLASAGIALAYRPADACSLSGVRGVRPPGHTHMIVVPTKYVLSAAHGIPRDLTTDIAARDSARRAEWARAMPGADRPAPLTRVLKARAEAWIDSLRPPTPYGQRAHVERIGGPDSLRLLAALRRTGGAVVLVQWGMDSMCSTVRSAHRDVSWKPGERMFVTGRLRPDSGWAGGLPTFDVLRRDPPYTEPPRGTVQPWLEIQEYWTLYEALPAYEELEQGDTARALSPLRAWQRAHPELAGHAPVASEIGSALGYAGMLPKYGAWKRQEQLRRRLRPYR